MALSDKQLLFANEYLIDFNRTQAALRAGYSKRSAGEMGSKLLKNPEVAEYVSQRLTESAMSADEALMRLAAHARGDIDDCLDDDGRFSLDKARKAKKTGLIKRLRIRETTRVIDETEVKTQEIDFELHDAQAALQLIGRHHKLFVDKTELTGRDGGPIEHKDVTELSDEDLARIAATGSGGATEAP